LKTRTHNSGFQSASIVGNHPEGTEFLCRVILTDCGGKKISIWKNILRYRFILQPHSPPFKRRAMRLQNDCLSNKALHSFDTTLFRFNLGQPSAKVLLQVGLNIVTSAKCFCQQQCGPYVINIALVLIFNFRKVWSSSSWFDIKKILPPAAIPVRCVLFTGGRSGY
jgi:hypothetical protein